MAIFLLVFAIGIPAAVLLLAAYAIASPGRPIDAAPVAADSGVDDSEWLVEGPGQTADFDEVDDDGNDETFL